VVIWEGFFVVDRMLIVRMLIVHMLMVHMLIVLMLIVRNLVVDQSYGAQIQIPQQFERPRTMQSYGVQQPDRLVPVKQISGY